MPENMDGTSVAAKTETVSAGVTEKTNGSDKKDAVDQRFAELTGELNRRKAREDKLEKELQDLKAKTATDEEKRVEELAQQKYGGELKAHRELIEHLTAERDALLGRVPDEFKGLVIVDDSIPVWKQAQQIRNVLDLAMKGKPVVTTPGGGNPPTKEKPRYTREQFQQWQRMSSDASTLKQYDEQRAEMTAALREGRIDGM